MSIDKKMMKEKTPRREGTVRDPRFMSPREYIGWAARVKRENDAETERKLMEAVKEAFHKVRGDTPKELADALKRLFKEQD